MNVDKPMKPTEVAALLKAIDAANSMTFKGKKTTKSAKSGNKGRKK